MPDPGPGAGGGGAPGALAELGLAGGRRVRARLVVGADGPRSHVRQLAGAPCAPGLTWVLLGLWVG